jgi:group I intron endonuclease
MDSKRNMLIHKALLKYEYSEFRLDILEFCNKEEAISREQYFLDLLNPEYNILKFEGSSLGHLHSSETRAKFIEIAKNKYYSEEEKARVSTLYAYRSKESKIKDKERMLKFSKAKSQSVEVLNTLTNEITIFESIRQAAEKLGCAHTSVRGVLKNKNLLKGIYKINYIN